MSNFPCLQTRRLLLRKFALEDAPAYTQLLQDPAAFPYISDHGPASRSAVEKKIETIHNYFQEYRHIYWAVIQKQSDQFTGYLAVHNMKEKRVSLSYAMLEVYRRKGFMTEAMAAVIDFLSSSEVETLEARVHPGNEASARLLESLNFKKISFKNGREIYQLNIIRYRVS